MITMSKAMTITALSMIIVFLSLGVISLVLSSFKVLFYKDEKAVAKKEPEKTSVNNEYEIDEEDRVVIALAASVMVGQGKINPNLHISSIKRIK